MSLDNIKGIETEPYKTAKIKDWELPKTMKDLITFLGFASYYRKFVKNFSTISAPLENIVKREKSQKKMIVEWTQTMEDSFSKLKTCLLYTSPSPRD